MDWLEFNNELMGIIKEQEDNYLWGGSEDDEGSLEPGPIDFSKMKEDIKKLIKKHGGLLYG